MKGIIVLATGCFLLLSGCRSHSATAADPTPSDPPANGIAVPGAQQDIHVVAPLPKHDWSLQMGDYGNTRFSSLNQITASNVSKLHVIWTDSAFGIPHGYEGGPLVVNQNMYVMTPFPDHLISYNLKNIVANTSGDVNWIYSPNPSNRAVGIACCDIVNRGGSYGDGMIVYNTLDDHTVAVNAKTGQKVWETAVGNPNYGETETMAPLVIASKKMVIVGISGGELGVRGRITGLDLDSGKIRWVAYSAGSDKDVRIGPDFKPFYKKDQGHDLGLSTWTNDDWKHGGGSVWGYMSYDPALNLFYYGTGNASPWNPDQHLGANKWTTTIFARDPTTGYAKWAWQVVPHPNYDYDQIGPIILVNMVWQGKMRKLAIHTGKSGFVYVIDRQTGQLLSAEPFQPVNWAKGFNLATGLAEVNQDKIPHTGSMTTDICPANLGAENWEPSAFSPRTGLLYIPARNYCMSWQGSAAQYIAGTPYLGVKVLNYPGPGGAQGELVAWNVAQAKPAWTLKEKYGLSGGALVTAGDVLFYGTLDGWFRAVDARTGKVLWQMKLASGIVSDPMTFVGPDGKQYLALYAGIGGAEGSTDFSSVSGSDPTAALGATAAFRSLKAEVSPGGLVYIFGL